MVDPLPGLAPVLGEPLATLVTQALYFAVAFVAVYLVGRLVVGRFVVGVLDRRGVDPHVKRPVRTVAHAGVVLAAVGVAFGAAGLGNFLTAVAAVVAAGTLAVGLATQEVLRNLVAGAFIYAEEPFRIGDWIEWDDHAGVVEDVRLRVTHVRTFDNELVSVPNATLTDGVVTNVVAHDRLRLTVDFGIGYDDDVAAATEILLDEAESHPDVLADPEPTVRLTELGDSAVVLQARIWIANPSKADVVAMRGDYAAAVKERFEAAGVDIPYPTRTLTGGIEVDSAAALADATG